MRGSLRRRSRVASHTGTVAGKARLRETGRCDHRRPRHDEEKRGLCGTVFLYQQRALDTLEALAPGFNRRKRASSLGEQDLAIAAFALGMGMEAKYFLVDNIWKDIQDGTLVEKCLAILEERKQQGCAILVVMDEFFLCGPGREHFKRILYMKMGALITDATPQTSVDKPLELLIEEWKRVAK